MIDKTLKKTLKEELDYWHKKICTKEFIKNDPVQFPHRYTKREDIEIAAILAATIAWGRRDLIIKSAEKMFGLMGESPYSYVMKDGYKKLKNNNIHRTFFENDLAYFCRGFKYCYAKYNNLEELFSSCLYPSENSGRLKQEHNIWAGIALFRQEMASANNGKYSKHISNPGTDEKNGSACKRLNLALRWLVRRGQVDLGLWKSVKPSSLYIPLDVHVSRTARKLGLLQRKSNDKIAVIELTKNLQEYCLDDPVKYDYALFGMGIEG